MKFSILEAKFALFSMYSTSSRLMLPTEETDLSSSELQVLLVSSISFIEFPPPASTFDLLFSLIFILRLDPDDPDDLESLDSVAARFLPLKWSGGRAVVFVWPACLVFVAEICSDLD